MYQEVHRAATSSNGVLNLRIGQGETAEYDFSSIDWSQAPYFVRLSMDTQGGDAYKEVAVSQMLSVPYALYAEKAGSVENAEEIAAYASSVLDIDRTLLLTRLMLLTT